MPGSVITAVVGALASNLVGGLLNKDKGPAPVTPPTVAPATPMPDPAAQKAIQRRKAAKLYEGQLTAANTVLTGGTADKLG